jgi:hypothetical protein
VREREIERDGERRDGERVRRRKGEAARPKSDESKEVVFYSALRFCNKKKEGERGEESEERGEGQKRRWVRG